MSPTFVLKFLAFGMLLPAIVLGLAQAAGQFARGRRLLAKDDGGPARLGTWEAALFGAVAYVWGHYWIEGWPAYPPILGLNVLVWVVGGAGLVATASALRGDRPFFSTAWVVPLALLAPLPGSVWQSDRLGFYAFLTGALLLVGWALMEKLAERAPGPLVPLAFVVALSGLSGVLVLGSGAKLGLLAGVLAGVAGTAVAIAIAFPGYSIAGSLVPTLNVGAMSLIVNARFYNDVHAPFGAYLLAWAAPLGFWIAELPPLRRRPRWIGATIGFAVVAVLLIIALVWTWKTQPPPSEYDEYY